MEYVRICEWCGKEFTTQDFKTIYCSHECGNAASRARKLENEKKEEQEKKIDDPLYRLKGLEQLSFAQTAYILGVSRQYIYKLVNKGELKATRLSSRKSLISRASIQQMIDAHPYTRITVKPKEEIKLEDYCTAADIAEKYKVQKHYVWDQTKANKTKKITIKGISYYERSEVESLFGKLTAPSSITEWLTPEEADVFLNITSEARRSFIHRHKIPTKKEHGKTYYSKIHIEYAKDPTNKDKAGYYSVEEIQNKFNLTRSAVYNYRKYYKWENKRCGNYTVYLKSDVDDTMNKLNKHPIEDTDTKKM